MTGLLFISMCFMHIVDDYYLQGFLAQGKTKTFWVNNGVEDNTSHWVCLISHGFSNSVMISIPPIVLVLINDIPILDDICVAIVFMTVIHAILDNIKANMKITTLIVDQLSHLAVITLYFTGLVIRGVV